MSSPIDDADWHEEDAGSRLGAMRHIAIFLWWCAERGLAADAIDRVAMAQAPVRYFAGTCAGTLTRVELNERGCVFAEQHYRDYLGALTEYGASLDLGPYELPADAATDAFLFAWLDARLAE